MSDSHSYGGGTSDADRRYGDRRASRRNIRGVRPVDQGKIRVRLYDDRHHVQRNDPCLHMYARSVSARRLRAADDVPQPISGGNGRAARRAGRYAVEEAGWRSIPAVAVEKDVLCRKGIPLVSNVLLIDERIPRLLPFATLACRELWKNTKLWMRLTKRVRAVSAVGRGSVGGFLLGPVGVLAGLRQKIKGFIFCRFVQGWKKLE